MTEQYDTRDTGAGITQPGGLQLDPARYRAEVDLFDISEEQKRELLATLWSIMRSFVELGFTVDVCAALMDGLAPAPGEGDGEMAIRPAFDTGDL